MKISPQIKRQLRWQNTFFVILFLSIIGITAWLSVKYEYATDWTDNHRNTPSKGTLSLLDKIEQPVEITIFLSATNKTQKSEIEQLLKAYQRHKTDITITFVDPIYEPDIVRQLGVQKQGEALIELADRQEKIAIITEQTLSNALQRLARTEEHWILFLEGHGERSPFGDSNYDFSSWSQIMRKKGLMVRGYNLGVNPNIPENTSLLIIADPQKNLMHGEMQILLDYIDKGGNLLWLIEPEHSQSQEFQGMEELTETFGIELIQGMMVDPNTQLLGINDTRFTLIPEYPRNPITEGFENMTIYPTAKAMEFFANEEWNAESLLETLPRTWSETDDFSTEIQMDAGSDIPGPLIIGWSLTRAVSNFNENEMSDEISNNDEQAEQRVVIIGDNDFASDAYIGQAGNLDMSMNIINWLIKDDSFINIAVKTNTDSTLTLSKTSQLVIGFGFLLVIPLGLLMTGILIWIRRRKR